MCQTFWHSGLRAKNTRYKNKNYFNQSFSQITGHLWFNFLTVSLVNLFPIDLFLSFWE